MVESTTTDWAGIAAFVGAAAWLPILGRGIYVWLSKPKLDVVLDTSAELGYTSNATILNINVAVRGHRKPALIVKVEVHMKHAQGREIGLAWSGISETLSQAESTSGDQSSFKKTLPAIALQVLPNTDVIQRKILFNDPDQRNEANMKGGLLARRLSRLGNNPTEEQIRATDEFPDLVEVYRNGFCWEIGEYECELYIEVQELSNPIMRSFTFSLTAANVAHIKSNVQMIEDELLAISMNEKTDIPRWSWYYPSVQTTN